MRTIRRMLTPLVGTLALTALGTLVALPAASAKTGPLSVQSVWVGDINQTPRTVLNSGDTATYHLDVYNTTGKSMLVDIEFEVFSADWASSYSYYYTAYNINMAAGLSRFYSPSTIPANAYTGDYIARISIWPVNSASPSNDGDWGEAYFHVFSLSVSPINNAIQTLQNAALCLGGFVTDGGDELLLTGVKTGTDAIGYFKDLQTGSMYWAWVKLSPIGTLLNCVSTVQGIYKMSQT